MQFKRYNSKSVGEYYNYCLHPKFPACEFADLQRWSVACSACLQLSEHRVELLPHVESSLVVFGMSVLRAVCTILQTQDTELFKIGIRRTGMKTRSQLK